MTGRSIARGVTLLELLVAIGILSMFLLVASSLVDDVTAARGRTEARLARVEGATIALDLVAERLTFGTVDDAAGGPGIVGDAISLRVTGSGVPLRRLVDGARLSPLVDRSSLELRLEPDGLALREDDGPWTVVVPGLFAVHFRYHDGEDWRERWDSGVDGLPVAVELSLWLDPWTEGRRPEWLPEPDPQAFDDAFEAAEEFLDFEVDEDRDPFDLEPVPLEEAPPPDRRRIVAVLDPVPLESPVDGSDLEDAFDMGDGS